MFTLIEISDEIASAQRRLQNTIRRDLKQRGQRNIGYPGGTKLDCDVATDYVYWYHTDDFREPGIPNPRRLNWFGLFKPDGGLNISVEINTGYDGRNDMVAGFFARDSASGATYLFHSGRVGGGTKGVGKTAFLAWSDLRPVEVIDSDGKVKEGVPVMPVDGTGATHSALGYIKKIADFKQAVRNGELSGRQFEDKRKALDDYFRESSGRRRGKRAGIIDYVTRHGDVVDALAAWRTSRHMPRGYRIVKNILIDLGVESDQELIEIYEVKSSTERQALYAAIGQTLVHGTASKCLRSIVVPVGEVVPSDLLSAMRRLGIQLIRFDLSKAPVEISL